MIELPQMAQLVDDDIVREMRRQKGDPVIEIQIAFFRAASPSAALIPYGHLSDPETVVRVPESEPLLRENPGGFLMQEILRAMRRFPRPSARSASEIDLPGH
jgi:hypothetical protein